MIYYTIKRWKIFLFFYFPNAIVVDYAPIINAVRIIVLLRSRCIRLFHFNKKKLEFYFEIFRRFRTRAHTHLIFYNNIITIIISIYRSGHNGNLYILYACTYNIT